MAHYVDNATLSYRDLHHSTGRDLIYYGEPGARKSTSLQDLCDSINLMAGHWATLLNLKDFSESDLKDEIDQIAQADHGADMQRYLLFDSLDEAHVRISRLVPFLDRESARDSLAGSRLPCFQPRIEVRPYTLVFHGVDAILCAFAIESFELGDTALKKIEVAFHIRGAADQDGGDVDCVYGSSQAFGNLESEHQSGDVDSCNIEGALPPRPDGAHHELAGQRS
jgi:hypothetical protein